MPAAPQKAKKTKKGRKHGRFTPQCAAYRATHRRERNKLRRALVRLRTHPNDQCLHEAIARFKVVLGVR
jgi:hypothetical protein